MIKEMKAISAFLIILGTFLSLGSMHTILARATLFVSGTVVSSETECADIGNRCVTTYVLEPDMAGAPTHYKAGPTDQSLPRKLPVGTHIRKRPWNLIYEIDGEKVHDFPDVSLSCFVVVGIALLGAGIMLLKDKKEAEEAPDPTGA